MIRFIKGKLVRTEEGFAVIDVNGIGIGLETPLHVCEALSEAGEDVQLHTYLRFGEDGMSLFGFLSETERDIFEMLVSTSGIGPRMGLAILSAMPVDDFVHAVMEKNVPTLTMIPGIGKKKAERLIVELKDKIALFSTAMAGSGRDDKPEMSDEHRMRINDAIEALISLGMKANDATKAIYGAFKEIGPDTTTTDLIKLGLKYK
jgi:Holliday junction DNA helicase RuvA